MRGIYGRGDVLAGALILSALASLFTWTQIVRSADDGVWSSSAVVNVERVSDIAVDIFNTTPTIPCEDQQFSWKNRTSGWVSRVVTTPYIRCATMLADAHFETGSTIHGRMRSFATDKTFGLEIPNLANVRVYPVPNSHSLVVQSWAYQNFQSLPSGLHIIKDYRLTMTDSYLDSAGNKIIKPGKQYDFELRGPDGGLISIHATGLKFSPDGQWMIFRMNYGGNLTWARLNLETHEVLAFATPAQTQFAVQNAISNDGRYVVLYEPQNNLRIYDLEKCSNGANKFISQQCAYINIYDHVKTRLGVNEIQFRNFAFKGGQGLSAYIGSKKATEPSWKYGEYMLRHGELPTSNGYLAMGDSFSSGEGAYDYRSQTDFYIDDTQYNLCHQSRSSYPYVLNRAISFEWLGSIACSGAVGGDITHRGAAIYQDGEPQAKGLKEKEYDNGIYDSLLPGYREQSIFIGKKLPSIATLTIGGNDIGFGDIVAACVNPLYTLTCYEDRDRREQLADLIDTLIPSLTATYKKIKEYAQSSNFRLYAIGYPHIVSTEGGCGLNVGMDHHEREFARGLVDYLNDAIRVAATNAGARYVDVSSAFTEGERDYRLCGNQTNLAVNGLVVRGTTGKKPGRPEYQESYHPNLLGHALLASKINKETLSLTQGVPLGLPIALAAKQDESLRRAFVGDAEQLIDIKKPGYENNLVQGPATRGGSVEYRSSSNWPVVQPNTKAVIELHSTPIKLGEDSFDAEGRLTGSVTIPTGVEPGYHELHVKYNDFFGDSVDRYQIIFVRVSDDDYDGDGVINGNDPCVISAQSGVDNDDDGTDDACDDEYVKVSKDEAPLLPIDDTEETLPVVGQPIEVPLQPTPETNIPVSRPETNPPATVQPTVASDEPTKQEDVTRVVESIAVLAAQPQPDRVNEMGVDSANTTDGHVLNEDTEVLASGTDSGGGYAKEKHLNLNELLIVIGALTVVSTATLLGSRLLGKGSS